MKASHLLGASLLAIATTAASPQPPPNNNNNNSSSSTAPLSVILDTDFNTIGDDGQAFAMAAQLHAAGSIHLLGVTIVAGNQYLDQGVSDALRAVERMGVSREVGVYPGANSPFLHTYAAYQLERGTFGNATRYVAAYTSPPGSQPLVPPPDGFAAFTAPKPQHAVDFIIKAVRSRPHEVVILALGPLTNIALAITQDPGIVPLLRGVVIMGGQAYAPGNTYRGAGETNWWFDAESARVVLRAPGLTGARRKIVGLDVTDTVAITNATYDLIAGHEPPTAVTALFEGVERWPYVYDTVALASLYDDSLDLDVRSLYVDVNCDFSDEYGRGLVWEEDPYPGLGVVGVSSVVFGINNARFFELYVDLLTRPISGGA